MTLPRFSELGLAEPLLRALSNENYTTPTPIQAQAIPLLLNGDDMLGIAQTGTGKTAAFALPILQALAGAKGRAGPRAPRALVLAPTRELAVQIFESFRTYGRHLNLRHAVILGGVGHSGQIKTMGRGVDVLVATPGRLLDLVQSRHVDLRAVTHFVLDEGDRMLDMGFINDVRKITAHLPKERQSLFFSATLPPEVERLAGDLLISPKRIEVTPKVITVERIDQHVFHVEGHNKRLLLTELLKDPAMARVIVFTRTKHGADRLCQILEKQEVRCEALHGNKAQNARQHALRRFREGHSRVMVATDIAARGLDVDGVTHVVNFELPNESESYVHRIGRTARAGADGIALSFCAPAERAYLRDIEKLIKRTIPVIADHPFPLAPGVMEQHDDKRPARGHGRPKKNWGGRPNGGRPGGGRSDGGRSDGGRSGGGRAEGGRSGRGSRPSSGRRAA